MRPVRGKKRSYQPREHAGRRAVILRILAITGWILLGLFAAASTYVILVILGR